jgi:anti-anti-sigma factor
MVSTETGEIKRASRRKFTANITQQPGCAVLHCSGRICFREDGRRFSSLVISLLKSGKNVVLDFSEVEKIDSAGIGQLVLVHMHAQACEVALTMVNPRQQIQALLELTNVASLFEVFDTVDSAMSSLTSEVA